jgi:CRISPR-associated protein Cmr1
MGRKEPKLATPPSLTKRETHHITQERDYRLITPLFGGGVEPAEADPVTIVRAPEIRGHLRFWWRATRGGQFSNLAALKRAEDAIWGAAARNDSGGPSQVQVMIPKVVPGKPFQVTDYRGNVVDIGHFRSPYSYVAFPLESGQTVQQDVQLTLRITYPQSVREDVEAALWAWETFGGIGARTRRGFGALQLVSVTENGNDKTIDLPTGHADRVIEWLEQKLATYNVSSISIDNVPHLGNPAQWVIKRSRGNQDPLTAWEDLFKALRTFRQQRLADRRGGQGRGRSTWCEPDALRTIMGQSLPAHQNPIPNPAILKFPRAAFGLPIGFQFKDSQKHNPNATDADPRKTSLEFESHDRLTSPLILKPLACRDDKAVGIALILQGTGLFREEDGHLVPREPVILKSREGHIRSWPVAVQLTNNEARQIPMLHGDPDVLQAFLDYLNA